MIIGHQTLKSSNRSRNRKYEIRFYYFARVSDKNHCFRGTIRPFNINAYKYKNIGILAAGDSTF